MYSNAILSGVAAFTFGASYFAGTFLFDQPFMRVVEMRVVDDTVIVKREYLKSHETIADWSVVIVPEEAEAPTCHTIHGPRLHEGWDKYPARSLSESSMTLDVWVNDPGCYDRLVPGAHDMFVTWTPRDGSDPVTARYSWIVEK